MDKPQNKPQRRLKAIPVSPREQRRNWQRENREKKTTKKQWTDSQPPNGNDAA